ncbi:MAG: hypothetical protein JWO78_2221 [Micavibrio sp.]|nr:hypothetical protein [Micavibrio sp.]
MLETFSARITLLMHKKIAESEERETKERTAKEAALTAEAAKAFKGQAPSDGGPVIFH